MTLKEQILNGIKEAMKRKDDFKRDSLRTLSAAFKQIEVDERIDKIIASEIKNAKMQSSFILKQIVKIWHLKSF
ncbi:hypothetical protein oki169_24970 [Helicobacter pylori]|nr:GatB/YqeY family protein [Campylobacter jejuni subsp. doylei]VEJ47157.1 GatB/YqeY family protein [Campylobacter jejuni subsp. doylei]VTX58059.1 Uncharacterised protein [Campylobacter jejuni]